MGNPSGIIIPRTMLAEMGVKAGDDHLMLGEFGNDDDAEFTW